MWNEEQMFTILGNLKILDSQITKSSESIRKGSDHTIFMQVVNVNKVVYYVDLKKRQKKEQQKKII